MPKRSSVRDVTTLYCRSATSPAAISIAISATSLVTGSSKSGAIRGCISRWNTYRAMEMTHEHSCQPRQTPGALLEQLERKRDRCPTSLVRGQKASETDDTRVEGKRMSGYNASVLWHA